jgi:ABC-type Fe3+ transport system permease subunit
MPRLGGGGFTALLLLPLLVFLALAFYYPLGFTVAQSLTDAKGHATLGNFAAFLGSRAGWATLGVTLLLSALATLASLLLCLPLAFLLRRRFAGIGAVRFLMMVPITIPALVGALGLLILYDRTGWVNALLVRGLHLFSQPIAIDYTLGGLVLFYVWMFFPYGALVIAAALGGMDPAVEEAARVCGAPPWRVLVRVILPLLRPALLAGSVMIFLQCFGAFSVPLIAGGNWQPIAVRIYTVANVFLDWHAASAMAVVMAVIQCVLVLAYQMLADRAARRQAVRA